MENLDSYIAVTIGCFLYILFQLNSVFTKEDFKWSIFCKTNIIPILINLTVGASLAWIQDDMMSTLKGAMITGFAGQALWKKITDIFDSDKKTVINI